MPLPKIGDIVGSVPFTNIQQCFSNEALKLSDVAGSSKKGSGKDSGKKSGKKSGQVSQKTPEASYKFQAARTDKRVSLNCAPLRTNTNTQEYIQRLIYVLGNGQYTLKKGQTIWGFLHSMLSKSCGLIFPYTPQISITHQVNYERSEITHSNLAISHYKNTPPPTLGIDATFTADTRENALHMLSALWFLRAVTKCDFGERANNEDSNCIPGMPPPILYLNGYNSIMDNIPVVVTNFGYTLPKDKHYVELGVNLDSNVQAFKDTYLFSDVSNNNLYASFDGNMSGSEGMKYLNGIANSLKSLQDDATLMETNRYNNYFFNNWLPTEMSFHIDLQVQPNLLKYKKKFQLNWYKMGLFNLDDYKGDAMSVVKPTSSGNVELNSCAVPDVDYLVVTGYEQVANTRDSLLEPLKRGFFESSDEFELRKKNQRLEYDKFVANNMLKIASNDDSVYVKKMNNKNKDDKNTYYELVRPIVENAKGSDIQKEYEKEAGGFINNETTYKFDRSGWTW